MRPHGSRAGQCGWSSFVTPLHYTPIYASGLAQVQIGSAHHHPAIRLDRSAHPILTNIDRLCKAIDETGR